MHHLAEGAVHNGVGFMRIGEHEGKVKHRELPGHIGKDAGVHDHHFQRAALQCRQILRIAAEHAAGEQIHLEFAAALDGGEFGKFLHATDGRMALGVLSRDLDRTRPYFLRRNRAGRGKCHSGTKQRRKKPCGG